MKLGWQKGKYVQDIGQNIFKDVLIQYDRGNGFNTSDSDILTCEKKESFYSASVYLDKGIRKIKINLLQKGCILTNIRFYCNKELIAPRKIHHSAKKQEEYYLFLEESPEQAYIKLSGMHSLEGEFFFQYELIEDKEEC